MFNPAENDHPCPAGLLHREAGVVLYILQYLLYAGIGREAAVHRQTDAGDETGCIIVQQKQQCAHKVFFAVAKVSHGVAARIFLVRSVGVPSSLKSSFAFCSLAKSPGQWR